MRLVRTVSEVGPRVGEHYGRGWAVPFHAEHAPGAEPEAFEVVNVLEQFAVPAGTACLVDRLGAHLVIVQGDYPPRVRD